MTGETVSQAEGTICAVPPWGGRGMVDVSG
jgi:hypothetical protein